MKEVKLHFGWYQKECHRLLDEVFDSKGKGYHWLMENFQMKHFSELKYGNKEDHRKLQDIYDKLLVKSILE